MNLVPNWRLILKRSYTAWMMYLLIIFSAIEVGLPYVIDGFSIPPGTSAILSMVVGVITTYLRMVPQPTVRENNAPPPESSE